MHLEPRRIAKPLSVAAGLVVVFTTYALVADHYRHGSMMAPDESFYALAARLVYEGKLPYRDFAYSQTPLLPYINGALLHAVGFGMDAHRTINAIWGGLGLALLVATIRIRSGRWEPALVAAFVLAASPRWVSLQAMGVWCGPAGAFQAGALLAALHPGPLRRRLLPFALCGTVAIGCRLTCAPTVAVLALPLLLDAGSLRRAGMVLAVCLGVGVVFFAPFFVAAPERLWFNIWRYHVESGIERNFPAQARQWWNISPAAHLLLATGLFGAPSLIRRRSRWALVLLAAGLVGVTAPMIPASAWGVYVAAGVPLAAAAGVCALWAAGKAASNPYRHAILLLPGLALLTVTPPEVGEGVVTEVEEVAAFIEHEVPPGPLLTPVGIVAVESGRDVLPGTEMGTFAAMAPEDGPRAEKMLMTTLPELTHRVRELEPAAVVRVIDPEPWIVWNFRWALPTFDDQPVEQVRRFEDALAQAYRPVWRNTTMEVLAPEGRLVRPASEPEPR